MYVLTLPLFLDQAQYTAVVSRLHVSSARLHQCRPIAPAFMKQNYQLAHQPGARFAPAVFVKGGLDPVTKREDFLKLFQTLTVPLLVVIGEQSALSSEAEMEAVASLAHVQNQQLSGFLSLHEAYASDVASLVLAFLK